MADKASPSTDSPIGTNGALVAIPDAAQPTTEAPAPAEPIHDGLLGELARAMHLAATSQYERMNAELERLRTEQVDAIGARASSEVESLKAGSEADIGAVDAWAKAETEKIKLERLRRIDARRERLAAQIERQGTVREREISAIQVAIDAHRGEVDRFFRRMERESDPAAIARVASTLPAVPSLAEIAERARSEATVEFSSIDAEPALSPTELEPVDTASMADPTLTAEPVAAADLAAAADPIPTTEPVAVPIEAGDDADAGISASRLMAVMDPDSPHDAAEEARPWEAPYAVSVAAGTAGSEAPAAPERPSRVSSTLLRTVRAIRPMSGEHHDRGGEH